MFAKSKSDAKLITKVNRIEYDDVVNGLELGTIIYPKELSAEKDSIKQAMDAKMDEISEYVTENIDSFSPTKENEFYDYTTTGLSIGGVYYGYYFSAENNISLPDFYCGNDLEKIQNDMSEDDGGVYIGKPNNGTDWCFIKEISDNWYYYELHWA